MDWLTFHFIARVFAGALVVLFVLAVYRVINSAANDLEWADLVSVPGRDGGRPRASWDQIGKGSAVFLCIFGFAVYVYSPKMDAAGIALVLLPILAYLAGVSAYAATLRARQGSVTTTTEPALDPAGSKTTTVQTPPIAASGTYGEGA